MPGTNNLATLASIPLLNKLYQLRKMSEAIEVMYTKALQGPLIGPVSMQALTPPLSPATLQLLENETNAVIDQFQALAATVQHVNFNGGISPVPEPGLDPK